MLAEITLARPFIRAEGDCIRVPLQLLTLKKGVCPMSQLQQARE